MSQIETSSLPKRLSVARGPGILAAVLGAVAAAVAAHAAPLDLSRGQAYSPVPEAAKTQAQLIVLRQASGARADQGAHIYVDGSLANALVPGSFARFCVSPGQHTIEAYVADAPLYAGKTTPGTQVELAGGKTYFVAVSEDGNGQLKPYGRAQMEPLLSGARELRYVANRAKGVEACEPGEAAPVVTYNLQADVLFAFARGDYAAITPGGRREIERLAGEIRAKAAQDERSLRVQVIGHADPIGRPSSNLTLSMQRAQSVRRALVEAGGISPQKVHASGVGSEQPVINCSRGRATPARIACNAPNRRVQIEVRGGGS